MSFKNLILLVLFSGLMVLETNAQESLVYDDPAASYRLADELMQRQEYGSAQRIFDKLAKSRQIEPTIKSGSAYGGAYCSFRLLNRDTDERFNKFLADYPVTVYTNSAWYYLGDYYFGIRSYAQSLRALPHVKAAELEPEKLGNYYFMLAYCQYENKQWDEAMENFATAKGLESDVQSKASYYYAIIAYQKEDYDMAYKEFTELRSDPEYYAVAPYYLADILYKQEKYKQLLDEVGPLYLTADDDYKRDLALMLGDASFRLENYPKAQEYLEDFLGLNGRANREMAYQMGYIYYKNRKYDQALEYFNQVTGQQDALTQSAYYHIGDCQLQKGKKREAQQSFYTAFQLKFDEPTREDALFNYAKLSYELSFDPYKEAINALKEYIRNFPDSPRIDEAWQYLVNLSLSSNNYAEALHALERINKKDDKILAARQKIYYQYGIELFNNKKYDDAAAYFTKAIEETYDLKVRAAAYFWLAETKYRQKDYDASAKMFNRFLWTQEAKKLPEYKLAYYNLGYAWFKIGDYNNAMDKFKAFIDRGGNNNPQLINDAHLRLGDCYYAMKRYADASAEYEEVIRAKGFDADYAAFQKAICEGVQGNPTEKIIVLRSIIDGYPESTYVDDAIFEIGLTYVITNKQENALEYFERVINEHENSSYRSKALLRKGLIYYNLSQPEKSLQALKTVVADYPGTDESREALLTIKNIYLDASDVDSYFAYVKDIPFANLRTSEEDSLKYIAAENLYLDEKFEEAVPAFDTYLSEFEKGAFGLHANYYLADCYIRLDQPENALAHFEKVVERPKSVFSEKSLVKAANLSFELNDYERALLHFNQLERSAENKAYLIAAKTGKMRAYKNLGKNDSTIVASFEILSTEKVPDDLIEEAHLNIAHAAMQSGNNELAMREFKVVSGLTQNESAAEASYYLAELQFEDGQDSVAMQSAFDLINKYPSYDEWIARTFILLADIYEQQGNIFQAKQTLMSIIENHDGVELVQKAQAKLDDLIAEEEAAKKLEETREDVQQKPQQEEVIEEENYEEEF